MPETEKRIFILRGDITKMGLDAIVNAANPTLLGGGGVDGAIHAAAGPELLAYCRGLNGCAVGEAKISPGFALPAPYVIHTVGPIWQDGQAQEAEKLAACYKNSLRLLVENQLTSIAFPAISTGVYGYPKAQAAAVAVHSVRSCLSRYPTIRRVYFAVFDAENERLYKQLLFPSN